MSQITALMLDSREPEWVRNLKFGGIPTMVTLLETGDMQAVTDDNCTLIIERKTLSDFLNTLREDRLFPQLARMTEIKNAQQAVGETCTQYCYIVITDPITANNEGKVIADRGVTGWSFASVMGTILSIQEMGVFVVFANGDLDYENTVIRIGKRDRKPHTNIVAPRPAKMLGPKIDFLTGIPGIGVEHAQSILEWSDNNVAHALIGLVDMNVRAPIPLSVRKRLRTQLLSMADNESLELVLHGDITNAPVEGNLTHLLKGEKQNA